MPLNRKIKEAAKANNELKNLAKKLAEFLAKLPEEELFYLTQTLAQQDIWYECRGGATLVGKCFRARFCGEKDPIHSWKRSLDDTKRIAYVQVWQIVDHLEVLWDLTQLSFSDLEEIYTQLEKTFPFNEPYQLFFEIIRIDENNRFMQVLEPTHSIIDLTTDDKIYALAEKKLREGKLKEKEEIQLINFRNRRTQPGNLKNAWLDVLLFTCQHLSKSNQLIENKLQELKRVGANICQYQAKTYSDARKNRNDIEIRSEDWIDGIRYVRQPNQKRKGRSPQKGFS